ncbi:MAG: transcription-repair coupling factor [Planctomycetes bacterium]|nr:transcription-repair coupling factor [Planctomycetota bacterium]
MSRMREPRDLLRPYRASEELEAARRILAGREASLGGFSGASLAFFLGAWKDPARPPGEAPCLVIAATEEEADELEEELAVFAEVPVLGFPAWDSLFLEDSAPDGDTASARLEALDALRAARAGRPCFVVAPVHAVLQPVPAPERLERARRAIAAGRETSPQDLARDLVRARFRSVPLVQARGELSLRGDILDVYPYEAPHPLRIELFGDMVESIREFNAETQRSIPGSERSAVELLVLDPGDLFLDCFRGREPLIADHLPEDGHVVLKEPDAVLERGAKILRNILGEEAGGALALLQGRLTRSRLVKAHALPVAGLAGGGAEALDLRFSSVERFRGSSLPQVFSGIAERLAAGYSIDVYCENAAEAKRVEEILGDHGLAGAPGIRLRVGLVRRGFEVVGLRRVVLTTRELFNRHAIRRVRRQTAPSQAIQSFLELERGDFVVHLVHGVARYLGMESFEKGGVLQEFLALEFRDGVKIYVPVSKIDLVQKYVGAGDRPPVLDKVGGTSWARKKEQVESALLDLASDLIDVQALRQARPGFACPPDSEWQRQLEASFPFEETSDQTEVSRAIKADMESPRPMDRLVCGDVGYGKTELAMRAAFKAVSAGKQVAVLVPTTVLAQQHFRTFGERMAEFPVTIDVLSRDRTPAEQKATLHGVAEGKVDILIGTHRLLSRDVVFKDLGLVVIDEEQRFGVAHKETLKRMRSTVDILTLTATPIPRTLHMSLLGIRDISSLRTAPEGRMAVVTEVCRFEPRRIREVILRELNRDGQVYFVHNRIQDIETVKHELERAVPEARIDFAHGQMGEGDLEEKMVRFLERELDVLISTTIIESGLDIPNVNTIFIDEADRYGLADLHQLRGRVGRYKHQAYCYLLLPDHRRMNPDAHKRVQALAELSALGSGFQIAMRDLAIRGAGNILGSEQSGHIALVGYEMYCRLLEKAVRRLKNEPLEEPVAVEIDLALQAFVPEGYLPAGRGGSAGAKLDLYRRISISTTVDSLEELERELEDRFGPVPLEVRRLLDVQRLRVLCASNGIVGVGRDDRCLVLRGSDGMRRLLEGCPVRVAVLDPRTAAVPLVDPARRYPPPVDDEQAFRVALEWLSTGRFPELGAPTPAAGARSAAPSRQ